MRRIGVLMGLVANDPEAQSRVVAFENGLRELGWVKGRNLSIAYVTCVLTPAYSSSPSPPPFFMP